MRTDDLIILFGNASRLARFLGISPQAIYQWPEYVPRCWGFEIEARSGGLIKYVPKPGSEIEKIVQMDISTFVDMDFSRKVDTNE